MRITTTKMSDNQYFSRILSILLLSLIFILPMKSKATHLIGGEITYRCSGGGNYIFQVKVFRDCTGISFTANTLTLNAVGVPGMATITLTRLPGINGATDISPACTQQIGSTLGPLVCNPPATGGSSTARGAISMFVYESGPVNMMTIPAPGANSPYLFYCNVTCCRNPNDNTKNCKNVGDLVLRCFMFRYVDPKTNTAVPPGILCDNAPIFSENPTSIQITNPTVVTNFNNNAFDLDNGDLLSYHIADPWRGDPTGTPPTAPTCGFDTIFGFPTLNLDYPFPGVVQVNGKGIDTASGIIYFRALRLGNYLTSIAVNSYRCGQLISTITRDFQLQVIPPPAGYPFNQLAPVIQAPFEVPGSNPPQYVYEASFFVGDTVLFTMEATDFFPAIPAQKVSIFYNGLNFGTNYSQPTGCPYPPCATLSGWPDTTVAPLPIVSNGFTIGYGFEGSQFATARFKWITACSNLANNTCGLSQTDFVFTVTAKDDQCPVPGRIVQSIKVKLFPPPILKDIKIRSINYLANGNVKFEIDSMIRLGILIPGCSTYAQSKLRQETSFSKILVWRSTKATGPYTLLSTITSGYQTSFTDLTANYFTSDYYYCTQIMSSCFGDTTGTSDTLAALKVNAVYNPTNGENYITWNKFTPRGSLPISTTGSYFVEWKRPTQTNWRTYITTTDTSLLLPPFLCNDTINLRIAVYDKFDPLKYTSSSDTENVVVRDIFPPKKVDINYVTTDTLNKKIQVHFKKATESDFRCYVVYKNINQGGTTVGQALDTICNKNDTIYVVNSLPISEIHYFSVAAIDTCGNIGLPGALQSNITTFDKVVMDKCDATITLNFSKYVGMPSGVKEYRILRSENNGFFFDVDTLLPAEDSVWVDDNLTNGNTYCYSVLALANDGKRILSNYNCVTADIIIPSKYVYLRYATIDSVINKPKIAVILDPKADTKDVVIQRSTNGVDFETIATLPRSQATQIQGVTQIYYIDQSAEPALQSYFYQVVLVDKCDVISQTSNIVSTICLKGKANADFVNQLQWNDNLFITGIKSYSIFRKVPYNEFKYKSIVEVFSEEYPDNMINVEFSDGKFCYFIRANDNPGNPYNLKDTVVSNILCLTQSPRIYFPTAFVADGDYTNCFGGKGTFIADGNYKLQVFSRWGEKVFETNSINKCWDGNFNDKQCSIGVYVYFVEYTDLDGNPYKLKGTFTLLR